MPKTHNVASIGNDDNSSTSTSSPWKTISKVNSKTFNSGDIILFRRGDIWSEILTPTSSGNIIKYNNNLSGTGALRCYQNTVLGNVNCLHILKCADVIVKNNIFYTTSATPIIDIGSIKFWFHG